MWLRHRRLLWGTCGNHAPRQVTTVVVETDVGDILVYHKQPELVHSPSEATTCPSDACCEGL